MAAPVFSPVATDRSTMTSRWQGSRLAHLLGRSHAFLALCDQAAISLTNFLTGLLIGRIAGTSELGLYAMGWTLNAIAIELSGSLTTTPYAVLGPRLERSERDRFLGSMLIQQIVLSLAASMLVLSGIAVMIFKEGPNAILRVLAMAAAVLVLLNTRELARRACFADLNIHLAVGLDTLAGIAQITGLVLLWSTKRVTALNTYFLLGAVSFLMVALWLFAYRTKIRVDLSCLVRGIKKNWDFAKWIFGSNLLWTAATYCYPWIITAFHGTTTTGVWAACCAVVAVGNPIFGGLGSYVGPKIANVYAREGVESMYRCTYRSSIALIGLLLPFVATLVLCGGRVLTKMYGSAYQGNDLIVSLLAINLLITAFTYPLSRGLFVLHAARADMLINVGAITFLFTFGLAAIKLHAGVGAAMTLLLTTLVSAVVRMGVFARASSTASTRMELSAEA